MPLLARRCVGKPPLPSLLDSFTVARLVNGRKGVRDDDDDDAADGLEAVPMENVMECLMGLIGEKA